MLQEEKLKESPKIDFTIDEEFNAKNPYESTTSEKEISEAIGSIKQKQKKISFLKSLFGRKGEKENMEMPRFEERVETPEVMPRFEEKVDNLILIEEKMHKARLALMSFRFEQAKQIYIEVMRNYNQLEPKKKAKVYQDIVDLYNERKSAEKYAR